MRLLTAVAPAIAALTVAMMSSGCGLILDFDDLEGLPCDCLPGFVCLSTSETCVPANSVDDFKSCDVNATPNASDQCQAGSDCVEINQAGGRCLPRCTPRIPFVAEVGLEIQAECGEGRYCWELSPGVGYCDDGECSDIPETCPPPQRCVSINGAGVCFDVCDIFSTASPCGATATHCQPVAETRIMACLPSGAQLSGEPCGLTEGACEDVDDQGRGLICTRPQQSTNPLRRCAPRCNASLDNVDCPLPGEGCFLAIPDIDDLGTDLGICQGG